MNNLVSIVILTYNRKSILNDTLNHIKDLTYKNIEIIIVDNNSTDFTCELLTEDKNLYKYLRLDKNIGVAGWNKGVEIATGNYILLLDDDAYPKHNSIELALEELEDEKVGCVAFNIYDNKTKKQVKTNWQPDDDKVDKCEWVVFIGCAAMFRSKLLKNNITHVPNDYFCDQHELPMALDMYNNGYNIIFRKDIIAYHLEKESINYNEKNDKRVFSNNLKYISNKFPIRYLIFYYFQIIIYYFMRSIRKHWFLEYFKIVLNNRICFSTKNFNNNYFVKLRSHKIFNYSIKSKFNKIKKSV